MILAIFESVKLKKKTFNGSFPAVKTNRKDIVFHQLKGYFNQALILHLIFNIIKFSK